MKQHLNPKYQAQRLLSKLQRLNCKVLKTTEKPNALMVHIDAPTPELARHSIEITEKVNGLQRRIRAARISGCCIMWEA
ncbi:hypothetical protein KCG43_11340 [Photobacterium sp. WH24]|uniref:hypothetical protein n=1 Tax=Photobacterium sp. WH24 TaxID=2827237 RepID=UPI001C47F03A|nr:hypothetical protein [Photobacterium sp. WH24]MBV7262590.1 hypothetical protein [Photobacterium sp. WH24]